MNKDIKEIKYTKRDDNVYMFKCVRKLTERQINGLKDMFKSGLPKDAKVILLQEGMDYIPPDNEALMNRLNDIEHSLDELMSLMDSRTR